MTTAKQLESLWKVKGKCVQQISPCIFHYLWQVCQDCPDLMCKVYVGDTADTRWILLFFSPFVLSVVNLSQSTCFRFFVRWPMGGWWDVKITELINWSLSDKLGVHQVAYCPVYFHFSISVCTQTGVQFICLYHEILDNSGRLFFGPKDFLSPLYSLIQNTDSMKKKVLVLLITS